MVIKAEMKESNSIRTIKGQSKGKAKALDICYRISIAFATQAVTEYRFAAELAGGTGKGSPARIAALGLKDWRFDVAIPEYRIAVEFDGGTWNFGRHSRGLGVISDMNKINAATVNGWRVLRYTHTNHTTAQIMADISRLIEAQK
jgi:hypothetical protein